MPYRAKTSFKVAKQKDEAVGRLVGYGQLVGDDDPLVDKYPELFEPADDYIERVERATQSPGEQSAAKKPAKKKKDAGKVSG